MVDEPVTVVVSLKGWVRALKGHEVDAATLAFKAGDALYGAFPCRSVDTLLVFGSNGRVYSVAASPAARRARRRRAHHDADRPGDPARSSAHYFAGAADARCCCWPTPAASACWRKLGDLVGRNKRRQDLPDARSRRASRCRRCACRPAHTQVACLALDGRLLVFALDELKLQPNGGRGLTLMDVDAKDAAGVGGQRAATR